MHFVDSETKSVDDGQLPTPVLYTVALEIRRCPVQLEYLEMVVSSERALCEALASRFNLHSKHTWIPSRVGKAASTALSCSISVITPMDPFAMPLSASMLLVRNMTFAPMLQMTWLGKFVPRLKTLEFSVPSKPLSILKVDGVERNSPVPGHCRKHSVIHGVRLFPE